MNSSEPPTDATSTATATFHRAMLAGCQELKKHGYWPAYFHREVAVLGGVQAVKNLLAKKDASEGFSTLYSLGRLDLAVEVFVLRPEFEILFTDDERRVARTRLDAVGYDIDRYLKRLQSAAPRGYP